MKVKKIFLIAGLLLLSGLLSSLFLNGKLKHPEKAILGTWKEVYWKYELVDSQKKGKKDPREPDTSLTHDIFSKLMIHKSENWSFSNNSGLTLQKENKKPVKVKWRLKGRGHILKLTYAGDTMEYYQIKELTDKKMVLHFENDVHARGIVKIVFIKN